MEVFFGTTEPGKIVYRFSALVKKADGSLVPMSMAIETAELQNGGEYACRLHFPYLREKPFVISGVDDDQAVFLAKKFVEQNIDDREGMLVDEAGEPIKLPWIPDTKYGAANDVE